MGGIIESIEPGSIADQLGWRVGDEIVSINGHELRDIIDYWFYCSESNLRVVVRQHHSLSHFNKEEMQYGSLPYEEASFGSLAYREEVDLFETRVYDIAKDIDESLGVRFKEILFDGVRTCGANCVFCFVDQLPKGLRKSLYLKDDDYRLSFLDGNFVTLANVTRADLDRIVEQRLSPLYVSVHVTDARLRESMLGRRCPNILEQIDTLARGRITLHTQIVLCRGINDGYYLDRTIQDLADRYPTVASIAIVPAGVTRHRRNKTPIPLVDAEYSAELLDEVKQWQRRFLVEKGTRLVWAADEFYLSAGKSVPLRSAYEGFPQLANGIGLVRLFLDSKAYSLRLLRRMCISQLSVRKISVVTGILAAPMLRDWAAKVEKLGLIVNVHAVRNRLFGDTVTVAGLIAGRDLIEQLSGKDLGEVLFVPDVAIRDGAFLDDVTIDNVESELGVRVVVVEPLPHRLISVIRSF